MWKITIKWNLPKFSFKKDNNEMIKSFETNINYNIWINFDIILQESKINDENKNLQKKILQIFYQKLQRPKFSDSNQLKTKKFWLSLSNYFNFEILANIWILSFLITFDDKNILIMNVNLKRMLINFVIPLNY